MEKVEEKQVNGKPISYWVEKYGGLCNKSEILSIVNLQLDDNSQTTSMDDCHIFSFELRMKVKRCACKGTTPWCALKLIRRIQAAINEERDENDDNSETDLEDGHYNSYTIGEFVVKHLMKPVLHERINERAEEKRLEIEKLSVSILAELLKLELAVEVPRLEQAAEKLAKKIVEKKILYTGLGINIAQEQMQGIGEIEEKILEKIKIQLDLGGICQITMREEVNIELGSGGICSLTIDEETGLDSVCIDRTKKLTLKLARKRISLNAQQKEEIVELVARRVEVLKSELEAQILERACAKKFLRLSCSSANMGAQEEAGAEVGASAGPYQKPQEQEEIFPKRSAVSSEFPEPNWLVRYLRGVDSRRLNDQQGKSFEI